VVRLAEYLDVPLRERNALLVAAGYAPVFAETPVDAPAMADVRAAIDEVLRAHEPWPAVVVDRHWDLVTANRAAALLVEGVAPELLGPPTNVLRACFHPDGLAPRISNLADVSAHVIGGLRRTVDATGDPVLGDLLDELLGYPGVAEGVGAPGRGGSGVAVTMRLRRGDAELAFVTMVAAFGNALDLTLAELTLETFLPADPATAAALAEALSV